MKNQNKNLFIIIVIISLLYITGITIGFLYSNLFNSIEFINFSYPEETTFKNLFFYWNKFLIPIIIMGFLPIGIFFNLPLIVFTGCFYGVTACNFLYLNNHILFLFNCFFFVFFTLAVFIVSASAMHYSLRKYINYKNPKANLKREKNKELLEYIVLCITSIFLIAICIFLQIIA